MRTRVWAGRVWIRPGTDLTRLWVRPTAQPGAAPARLLAQPQTRVVFCSSAAPALCQLLGGTAVKLRSPRRGHAWHQHPTGHPPLPGIGSPTTPGDGSFLTLHPLPQLSKSPPQISAIPAPCAAGDHRVFAQPCTQLRVPTSLHGARCPPRCPILCALDKVSASDTDPCPAGITAQWSQGSQAQEAGVLSGWGGWQQAWALGFVLPPHVAWVSGSGLGCSGPSPRGATSDVGLEVAPAPGSDLGAPAPLPPRHGVGVRPASS